MAEPWTRKRLREEEEEEEEEGAVWRDSQRAPSPKMCRVDSGTASSLEVALRNPAPCSSEATPPQMSSSDGKRRRLSYEKAKQGTAEPVRVYADGVFDMFHNGHARVLMQAKNAFPNTHLLVGVTSDEDTQRHKGKTVMCEVERYDAVKHCRYVDEVVEGCPWLITPEFIEKHKIDFVAHDDLPYEGNGQEDIYKPLKEQGMFVATQRTEGVSTSDIIARIVRDYDMYVRRNLSRGYTAKEMNLGFMKEKEVRIREGMSSLRGKSRDLISGFMGLFGRDGRISEFFHNHKQKMQRALSPDPLHHHHEFFSLAPPPHRDHSSTNGNHSGTNGDHSGTIPDQTI